MPLKTATAVFLSLAIATAQGQEPVWDTAVGGGDTVYIEEMTAGEVAAAIRAGSTSVIVATGGVEQNGPHVVTGKHNYVLQVTANAIAQAYGNTLVAPTAFRNNVHTDLHYEAIVSLVDPQLVGARARLEGDGLRIHGVQLDSIEELQDIGRKLTAYRTDITVKTMHKAVANAREAQ